MPVQAAVAELQQQLDLERQHRQQLQQQLAATLTGPVHNKQHAPPSQEHATPGSALQLEAALEAERPDGLAVISRDAQDNDPGETFAASRSGSVRYWHGLLALATVGPLAFSPSTLKNAVFVFICIWLQPAKKLTERIFWHRSPVV